MIFMKDYSDRFRGGQNPYFDDENGHEEVTEVLEDFVPICQVVLVSVVSRGKRDRVAYDHEDNESLQPPVPAFRKN